MDSRRLGEQSGELLRVILGDLPRVEVTSEAFGDRRRADQGAPGRDLLVQNKADQKGERTSGEQGIGSRILAQPKAANPHVRGHHASRRWKNTPVRTRSTAVKAANV